MKDEAHCLAAASTRRNFPGVDAGAKRRKHDPMVHPLERKIATLRGRARRLVVVYGLSWVVTAVLGAVLVLGWIDYLVRLQDRGIRVMCLLLVLGILLWTCYRYLYFALIARLRDVDLAHRLQRRFPALQDRLVTAVEFLRQPADDPLAGSAALRRAVIAQTTEESRRLDFCELLDRRPPLRAALSTAAICLVAAILVVLDPTCSRIAVARLLNPFGAATWPQKNHLELRHRVERVARGQAFEVEVLDAQRARLPPDVRIHYRFQGPEDEVTEQTEPMRFVGRTMVARRENVIRPFSYRVEGGDDDSMPWTAVEVVEPPAIERLSIRLVPPPYTGWPPEQAGRHIRAIVGTQLRITGKATRPLESVTLHVDGDEIPARISNGGYRFTVGGVVVKRSGAYWFELTDREGIRGGMDDRWEIRAVPDLPPSVTIEQPTGDLFVTVGAVVPLQVVAKDDLAVHEVALVFEQPKETVLPLYTGAESGDRRVIEYRWDLAPLELAPGTQLEFHATADDYKPQTGTSRPRRLIVITGEELQERIAGRESLILAELARVLKMQRSSRSQVASLAARLSEVGQLGQLDVDHLQAAELNQRQVNRGLSSRSEGVPAHILALLSDLENNRIDSPNVRRRMQGLLGEIDRLGREHLAAIGRDLTAAIKSTRAGHFSDQLISPVADLLADAGEHQDRVIASLERLLGQLALWDEYRRFHREVGQLVRDQEELTRRSGELGRRTLTKRLKELRPQESADLKVLAGRQLELARQFDCIQQSMEQADDELRSSDPPAAETVADALERSRRLAISGQMRTSADQLGRNQIGRAVARQKQIVADLQKVLEALKTEGPSAESSTAGGQPQPEQDAGGAKPGDRPAGSGKTHKPDMQQVREVMKQLWGELPPHQREQMLQLPLEEFLPKYELLIEEYFRRLSEEKDEG